LENTYLENGQLENGQLKNRHLENEKYLTWPSSEGVFSIWSGSKSFLQM